MCYHFIMEFTNCINTVKDTASLTVCNISIHTTHFAVCCAFLHYFLILHAYHTLHMSDTHKVLSCFMEVQNRWVLYIWELHCHNFLILYIPKTDYCLAWVPFDWNIKISSADCSQIIQNWIWEIRFCNQFRNQIW